VSRDASLARIEDLKAKAVQLEVANARVAELEESLGMTTERAQASELRQRRVDALESLFRPNEARILQEEGNVIIRLIGLSFDSGESLIKSQYFQLLRKIADVPDIFPGASLVLVVEGHTDSVGNDTMNLALSERRANSVRDYLLASTILPGSQVRAVGYGETRPVANNETAEGRAMNRRIDVVIVPDER
jgi:outer membrane protein OmpA-like peptidoglycan-associated protein